MAVYSGHEGAVFIASGAPVTITSEPTTANAERTRYQISDPSKRFLTRTGAVTVETDMAGDGEYEVSPPSAYRLQRLGGIVEFTAPLLEGTQVRISGSYMPLVELGNCQGWSFDISREVHEYVVLRTPFMRKHSGVGNATGSIDRLWFDGTLFDLLKTGSEVVLVLYVNYDSSLAYACYATLGTLGMESSGDGLVAENVDFESNGTPVYGITL